MAERDLEVHIVDPGELVRLGDLAAIGWARYFTVTEQTLDSRMDMYVEKKVPQWLIDKIEERLAG